MTFLDSIIERKKREAAALPTSNPHVSDRSLHRSLAKKKTALIAEIKPKSPSEGPLMNPTDLPRILRAYNAHAQAISVLCDHDAFGGGYDLLASVRTMTDLPILAKEFIVDTMQIRTARSAGADAVLLIAAMLSKVEAQSLAEEASALGMCVLFEIHQEKEIATIPMLPPDSLIIGINNRNLDTLTIDLHTTTVLAPMLRASHPDNLLLSESGIASAADVESLKNIVNGFLIGTTFLKASDPKNAILSLFPHS